MVLWIERAIATVVTSVLEMSDFCRYSGFDW